VKLEEQRRLFVQAFELRVADARAHLHIVEQLDPRDRDPALHRHDHRARCTLSRSGTGTPPPPIASGTP
jgi:hypothetical protein